VPTSHRYNVGYDQILHHGLDAGVTGAERASAELLAWESAWAWSSL
jgi:hypothetical protein